MFSRILQESDGNKVLVKEKSVICELCCVRAIWFASSIDLIEEVLFIREDIVTFPSAFHKWTSMCFNLTTVVL